jgi:peptidoglycan-associated lipoprotein
MKKRGNSMTYLSKTFLLIAGVSLAACSGAGRFDDGAAGGGLGAGGTAAGMPAPETPQYFQQAVGDRVFFAVDQSSLSSEAKATLDGQADWLGANGEYDVVIEGHADEQGTREYNLALGARRANAVREYLVSQGVPADRMRVVSYGKERPIEICSAESCYAKNRRAVTVISAVPTS